MSNLVLKTPSEIIDSEQLEILKNQYSRDLNELEFRAFIHVCRSTNLDPLRKQIYAVKRDGKMVVQTGIDGFRAIAFRTQQYAGRDETQFDYDKDKLIRAKVTVYKLLGGLRCPFTATANWDEYYPGEKLGFMWRKMPEVMLGKCAEAQALRMAFPEELSGLYSDTEMQQADGLRDESAKQIKKTVKEAIDADQLRNVMDVEPEKLGEDMESALADFEITFGKFEGRRLKEIPLSDLSSYVRYLENESAKRRKPLEGRGKELVLAVKAFLEESTTLPGGSK